ncbi:FAD binding protein [Nitzschia inconspicua]|uniref:FAD binding protein n=1 Tax=Nitzschia inconspicua TaxID=303405 RepID=A0A9K3KD46_9STRA|nr:FAD binding protein [Nitzschia inconspicua]
MSNRGNTMAPDTITSCHILWSTQSGRAKACARRAARILREQTHIQLLNGMGCPFDDVSFVKFVPLVPPSSLLIMFVSTTGDGEHCDSIKQTWKALLQKSLSAFEQPIPTFALFCLGDRAYGPQFCAAGRKLAVRLLQLGMKSACEVGYGDDNTPNGGVFWDLDVWLEGQLLPICPKKPVVNAYEELSTIPIPYRVHTGEEPKQPSNGIDEWRQDRFFQSYREYFSQSCPISAYEYNSLTQRIDSEGKLGDKTPLLGTITVNERITTVDWEQDTRHIRISIHSDESVLVDKDTIDVMTGECASKLPYQAGDVASILPFNSEKVVAQFLAVLPDTLSTLVDTPIRIESDDELMGNQYTKWPQLCTLRGWLTYCADIQSLPEREDLRALSRYCSPSHGASKEQAEKLSSLSETSQSALYADYILREKRSWADVLYDFESLRSSDSKLTLEALLMLLPRMRPREFSIASSPTADQRRTHDNVPVAEHATSGSFSVELCVAIVEGTTRLGRQYHGLCSNFLSRLIPSEVGRPQVVLWIRPGSFTKLPIGIDSSHSFETPILCVGAGTGVAPMRSLLLERNAVWKHAHRSITRQDQRDKNASNPEDNILVFGCRSQSADYYYKNEWETLQHDGMMRLLPAFSRDQVAKVYVQKVLAEADGRNLISSHILDRSGGVYIAGGPKMARAVREEIVKALTPKVGDEKRANRLLAQLQRAGKFSVEAWS